MFTVPGGLCVVRDDARADLGDAVCGLLGFVFLNAATLLARLCGAAHQGYSACSYNIPSIQTSRQNVLKLECRAISSTVADGRAGDPQTL